MELCRTEQRISTNKSTAYELYEKSIRSRYIVPARSALYDNLPTTQLAKISTVTLNFNTTGHDSVVGNPMSMSNVFGPCTMDITESTNYWTRLHICKEFQKFAISEKLKIRREKTNAFFANYLRILGIY